MTITARGEPALPENAHCARRLELPGGETGPNATFNPVTGENEFTCTRTTTRVDYTCPAGYDLFVAPSGDHLCREQANPTNAIPATPVPSP